MKDDGLFAMAGLDTGFGREGGRSFHLAYLPELNCRATLPAWPLALRMHSVLGAQRLPLVFLRIKKPERSRNSGYNQ